MKRRSLPTGLIAALLLAGVVGGTTIDGGFVYDDVPAILENPLVQGEAPLYEAFGRSFWGKPLAEESFIYRPLPSLLWRLLWSMSSYRAPPRGGHGEHGSVRFGSDGCRFRRFPVSPVLGFSRFHIAPSNSAHQWRPSMTPTDGAHQGHW